MICIPVRRIRRRVRQRARRYQDQAYGSNMKKRVLLVDDEPRVRASLRTVLEPTYEILEAADAALARLEQVGLRDLAQADAKDLPYGAKKRLELAIALAGLPAQGPRLLLLDEPAAGLAAPERAELMARVTALAREGVAVLYTEHNMDAVFGVADRVLVLIDGLLAASGTPQEVALDATVRSRYLGRGFQAGDVHV